MAEDLGKRIGAFGQNVWKKAQGAVNIVAMNNDIAAKTRALTELYAKIGEAYCCAHREMAAGTFPELSSQAFALAEEIAGLEELVQLEKGLLKCPACGAMAPASAAFCPACGAAMPEPAPKTPDREPLPERCDACGAAMETEDVFCSACGRKRR